MIFAQIFVTVCHGNICFDPPNIDPDITPYLPVFATSRTVKMAAGYIYILFKANDSTKLVNALYM